MSPRQTGRPRSSAFIRGSQRKSCSSYRCQGTENPCDQSERRLIGPWGRNPVFFLAGVGPFGKKAGFLSGFFGRETRLFFWRPFRGKKPGFFRVSFGFFGEKPGFFSGGSRPIRGKKPGFFRVSFGFLRGETQLFFWRESALSGEKAGFLSGFFSTFVSLLCISDPLTLLVVCPLNQIFLSVKQFCLGNLQMIHQPLL